jgi:hypothetical protein
LNGTKSSHFSHIGSARDDNSRTVWHVPLVVGIPLLRWSAGPFITTPFRYPDIDHESLLGMTRQSCQAVATENHPIKQALKWQEMMEADPTLNQAQIAASEGVSRARVCQLMRLLSLAPEIQRVLIETHDSVGIRLLNERRMREIAAYSDRRSQLNAFQTLRQTTCRQYRCEAVRVTCDGERMEIVGFEGKKCGARFTRFKSLRLPVMSKPLILRPK